ncbi:28S ribosomal protein S26, mitochondrial isoform X2 [Mustela putorius furo]|uniref:Small ribosomal subunit protein mS26 n=1 Tax=Mustela putorius furo TaxID=9669 RepID=A0A8U0SIL6_MUSPF|nr:28S ribosomal protein S26, mitochondrial isoform X2 [Mustela putorius furo]
MIRALRVLGRGSPGGPPAPLLLQVRGRKTRYDPPAKSKVGRVTTPPAVDPVEFFLLTERYRLYRQTVRALRLEFVSEVRKKVHEARVGVLAERKALQDATEHRDLMAWNQAENQRLLELRRKQKISSPQRTWRHGWKKLWTHRRATTGPSPERGWWSGHSTRALKSPLRTVPTQGPCVYGGRRVGTDLQ